MRLLREFPRLLIFGSSTVLAYVLYQAGAFDALKLWLNDGNALTIFLGGFLYSFGFTAPFAVAYFVEIAPEVHPGAAALIAGFGSLCSDIGIFRFAQLSFREEYLRLKTLQFFHRIRAVLLNERFSERTRGLLRWSLAVVIIASPLPDEIGIALLVGFTNLTQRQLAVLSLLLNTAGIFLILLAAQALR